MRRQRIHRLKALSRREGYTLAEMVVASAVLATIGISMGLLFSAGLRVHEAARRQDSVCRTANMALLRIKFFGRESNRLFLPNAKRPDTHVLAFASMIDNDGDGLFNEDPPNYVDTASAPGVAGVDDDGDGSIDEGQPGDDDEDGQVDEDPVNGLDDDGDGAVDEDAGADLDALPGAKTKNNDDDGDGKTDEDPYQPIVYTWDSKTKRLYERHPLYGRNVVAEDVEAFDVKLTQGPSGQCLVSVSLRIKTDDGKTTDAGVSFYMRNAAFIGKRLPPVDPGVDPGRQVEPPQKPSDDDDDPGRLLAAGEAHSPFAIMTAIREKIRARRHAGGRSGCPAKPPRSCGGAQSAPPSQGSGQTNPPASGGGSGGGNRFWSGRRRWR